MTQAPIHPRHKDMAAKAAGYALLVTHEAILAHAQTLANDEAKAKALAEIAECLADMRHRDDCTCVTSQPGVCGCGLSQLIAIAAPYRASDPVADHLEEVLTAYGLGNHCRQDEGFAPALAKFRAFIEGDR